MRKVLFAAGIGLLMATAVTAAEWRNVDETHYRAGRKASAGYLCGKVVLVDRWGVACPPCRRLLPRMEMVWRSFKSKPFVLLGSHCVDWGDAESIRRLASENKLTYPIYEDAGLANEPPFNAIPFLYVVDATGQVVYKGYDERVATEAVVSSLTDYAEPRSLEQWKSFLAFELEHLPGHAYNRLDAFRKKFPDEVAAFGPQIKALAKVPDVKKIAAFVRLAQELKDAAPKTPAEKQRLPGLIADALRKNAALAKSADPRVAQEAKNAIADLKWAKAAL